MTGKHTYRNTDAQCAMARRFTTLPNLVPGRIPAFQISLTTLEPAMSNRPSHQFAYV